MKLKIEPNGDVRAVYNDVIPGLNLGDMEVKRASNVEYNHLRKKWEARLVDSKEVIASNVSRNVVIAEEVALIESRL